MFSYTTTEHQRVSRIVPLEDRNALLSRFKEVDPVIVSKDKSDEFV